MAVRSSQAQNAIVAGAGNAELVNGYPVSRTVSYMVAASNASTELIAQSDYQCDGVADDLEIQAAIDAVETSGGVVILTQGTFTISNGLTIQASNVTVRGAGYGTYIVAPLADQANILGIFTVNKATGSIEGVEISNLRMRNYGHGTGGVLYGEGIILGGNATIHHALIENIWFTGDNNAYQSAILAYSLNNSYIHAIEAADTGCAVTLGGATYSTIRTVRGKDLYDGLTDANGAFTNLTWDDITGYNTNQGMRQRGTLTNVRILNCQVQQTTGNGLTIGKNATPHVAADEQVEHLLISNYTSAYNGYGVYFDGPEEATDYHYGIQFVGCHIHDNSSCGMFVDQCKGLLIAGCQIYNNGQDGTIADKYQSGIYIIDSQRVHISGNQIFDTGAADQLYGVYEDTAGDYNSVIGNDLWGHTTGVYTTGSNTKVHNNAGWLTENHGTATLLNGQTSIAFAHGLAATPTHVSVSWKENPSNLIADWWWTADGTNVTVNGVDPGASNLDFSWEAKV